MDRTATIETLFGVQRALIGVVHLQALPGTPSHATPIPQIVAAAVEEARMFQAAGFDGLILENMHDRPYTKRSAGPEIVASMTAAARAVGDAVDLPFGVQILAGANREALAVAQASGAAFVRVEGFVFAHVADEGLMEADAGDLLRYRKAIGASVIRIFADIKKKHSSHALTADVDLVETAQAAEFFQADGVVVTGAATGRPADPIEVDAVSTAVGVPTLVGSGITEQNIAEFGTVDAFIVGSSVKVDGLWSNPMDPARLEALARAFRSAATPA